jgi:hypothetical protein
MKDAFVAKCGSSLGEILSQNNEFPVAVNALDADLGINMRFHEQVAAKPSWQLTHECVALFDADPHQ